MPGYTHLQRAQPILLAHHLLAYVFMLERDRERLANCRTRTDVLPLGAAALAGTAFPIDREALAADLGFAAVAPNSLDAVSDRDYVLEFLAAAAIIGMHLSRLAADLTLWATAEFGFVEIADGFATGSSIMPQKKNPDVAGADPRQERAALREPGGRAHDDEGPAAGLQLRHAGGQGAVLRLRGHPGGRCLAVLPRHAAPPSASGPSACARAAGENFATATDLADYLVRKGLPFRQAHEVVGRIVRRGIERGRDLLEMSVEELREFSALIDDDVRGAISVEASLRARAVTGGTAPDAVRASLALARTLVGEA